jgi:peptide/nickel transport system ATP-binding protein
VSEKFALDIQGLSVALPESADRALAIENMNLQVRPQEIVCIVGESGSASPSPHCRSWVCCRMR